MLYQARRCVSALLNDDAVFWPNSGGSTSGQHDASDNHGQPAFASRELGIPCELLSAPPTVVEYCTDSDASNFRPYARGSLFFKSHEPWTRELVR
jgi:hypothetical protein